jgi:hypothetical protein
MAKGVTAGIDCSGLHPVVETILCIDVVSDNDNADGSLLQFPDAVNRQILTISDIFFSHKIRQQWRFAR